jgi:hypothetical protein
MLKRLGVVVALAFSSLAFTGCDPCSIACLLCLTANGGGGGQAVVAPGTAVVSSPQLKAITAHAADAPQRY